MPLDPGSLNSPESRQRWIAGRPMETHIFWRFSEHFKKVSFVSSGKNQPKEPRYWCWSWSVSTSEDQHGFVPVLQGNDQKLKEVTVGSVGYIMLHLCVKHLPPQSSPATNKWWSCHVIDVIAHLKRGRILKDCSVKISSCWGRAPWGVHALPCAILGSASPAWRHCNQPTWAKKSVPV